MDLPLDFDSLVASFYEPLYRFAYSLTRSEADACDLAQQTFYLWAVRGYQLRDPAKVKSWLFTTLHREFLQALRRQERFPHQNVEPDAPELPSVSPSVSQDFDAQQAVDALEQVDPLYRAAVSLFYLQDYAYKEIAEVLEVPLGTVKSRIARGICQLQAVLADNSAGKRSPK